MLDLDSTPLVHPYEAIVMMDPDSTVEDQKGLFTKNKFIIESFSGEYHHIDTWGKRRLSASIKRKNKAIYFHSTFKASAPAIKELERTMQINEKVLRVIHTRLSDQISLEKYVSDFKDQLAETLRRETEIRAKFKKTGFKKPTEEADEVKIGMKEGVKEKEIKA